MVTEQMQGTRVCVSEPDEVCVLTAGRVHEAPCWCVTSPGPPRLERGRRRLYTPDASQTTCYRHNTHSALQPQTQTQVVS